MYESSFSWICDILNIKLQASRVLRLLWVDGYGSIPAAKELGMTQAAVCMCSGRHLRKAEQRAEQARLAAEQVAELRQQQAALSVAESAGEADEYDRAKVTALELACTEEVRLLAMEHLLWRTHFFGDPPPDHEADPDALPPPVPLGVHARELLQARRGPRKKAGQSAEYDANGRRVGAPSTLITGWEMERLCERVRAERGITFEMLNPPL
jgi:hypothetical protein